MSELQYLLMLGVMVVIFFFVLFRQLAHNRPVNYITLNRNFQWFHQPLPKARPKDIHCPKCNNGQMLPVKVMRVDVDSAVNESDEEGKRHTHLVPHGLGYLCDNCGSLYRAA